VTFYEQMLDLWHNIFQGEKQFMYFIGFCMITFAPPFFLILLQKVIMNLHFYFVLRKRHPEEWKWIVETSRKRGNYKVYKNWLTDKSNYGRPFWLAYRQSELFGKICLAVWCVVVLAVALAAIFRNLLH